jgi:hypothetical protein
MSEDEPQYVDTTTIRLDHHELTAPDGIDVTDEHVQWAMNTQLPGHITGIDYGQQQGGQYVA